MDTRDKSRTPLRSDPTMTTSPYSTAPYHYPAVPTMPGATWYPQAPSSSAVYPGYQPQYDWSAPSWTSSPYHGQYATGSAFPRPDAGAKTYDQNFSIPNTLDKWHPDEWHFDGKESFGLKLPRTISSTRWADEHHFSNRSPFDIRLWELAAFGQDNYLFRALGAGRYVGVEYVRNARESQLVGSMLKHLRESRVNLDSTIEQLCTENAINASTTEGRTEAFQILAKKLVNVIHTSTYKPQQDPALQAQLSQAEQDNSDLRTQLQTMQSQMQQLQAASPAPKRSGAPTLPASSPLTPKSSPLARSFSVGAQPQDKADVEEEGAQDDVVLPVDDTCKDFKMLLDALQQHPAKQQEVLQKQAPINTTAADVDHWIGALKMPADKKRTLQTTLQAYNKFVSRSSAANLSLARDLLVKYGMPSTKANNYKLKPAIHILVTATYLIE